MADNPEILCSTQYLNLIRRGHWVYASRPNISGVVCIATLTRER